MRVSKKVTNYQIECHGLVFGETLKFPNRAVKIVCHYMPRQHAPGIQDFKGHTTSNKTGHFRFIFNKEDLIPGIYRFRFYGTGHLLNKKTKERADDAFVEITSNDLYIPRTNPIIYNLKTAIWEEVRRDGSGEFKSNAYINLWNGLISGEVNQIKVQRRFGNTPAKGYILFDKNVEDQETLVVDNITYVFKDSVNDTINNPNTIFVKRGNSREESSVNLFKALNNEVPLENEGITYQNPVGVHPVIEGHYLSDAGLMLTNKLEAQTPNLGNNVEIIANNININSIGTHTDYLFGGTTAEDYPANNHWVDVGSFGVGWDEKNQTLTIEEPLNPGSQPAPITGGNSAFLIIPDIPHSHEGLNQEFRLTFFDRGKQALTATLDSYYIKILEHSFDGKTDELDELEEWAAVLNLQCVNSELPDGGSLLIPAKIPGHGIARLKWDDMSKFTIPLKNHPVARFEDNSNNQKLIDISVRQLANVQEYIIFMHVPDTNNTQDIEPSPAWPTELTDNLAHWVMVTRTKNTYYDVVIPLNKVVSFWVGFGSSKTLPKSRVYPKFAFGSYNREQALASDPGIFDPGSTT